VRLIVRLWLGRGLLKEWPTGNLCPALFDEPGFLLGGWMVRCFRCVVPPHLIEPMSQWQRVNASAVTDGGLPRRRRLEIISQFEPDYHAKHRVNPK